MNARFTRLIPLALIATVPLLCGAQNSAPRETVLNHVSVIDMTGRPIQRDMAVLLRGDRIAAIERAAGFNVPAARVLGLTGKFLIPGSWTCIIISTRVQPCQASPYRDKSVPTMCAEI